MNKALEIIKGKQFVEIEFQGLIVLWKGENIKANNNNNNVNDVNDEEKITNNHSSKNIKAKGQGQMQINLSKIGSKKSINNENK